MSPTVLNPCPVEEGSATVLKREYSALLRLTEQARTEALSLVGRFGEGVHRLPTGGTIRIRRSARNGDLVVSLHRDGALVRGIRVSEEDPGMVQVRRAGHPCIRQEGMRVTVDGETSVTFHLTKNGLPARRRICLTPTGQLAVCTDIVQRTGYLRQVWKKY